MGIQRLPNSENWNMRGHKNLRASESEGLKTMELGDVMGALAQLLQSENTKKLESKRSQRLTNEKKYFVF